MRRTKHPEIKREDEKMEMNRKTSLKGAASLILAAIALFLIASCTTASHGYLMKGSIMAAFSSSVYLDIGSGDGASVGQELDVYEAIMYNQEHAAIPASKGAQTGKVKITEILDKHLAKAVIISGKVHEGDIVELPRAK